MTSQRQAIADSGLFDELFYYSCYQSYIKDFDPLDHYLVEGDSLGFFPNSLFEPSLLRRLYPIPDSQTTLEYFILHLYNGFLASIPSRWWQSDNHYAQSSIAPLAKSTIINGAYGTGRHYFNYLVKSQQRLLPYFRDCQQYCYPSKFSSINSTHAFFTLNTPYSWSDLSDFLIPDSLARSQSMLISVVRHPIDCLISNWIWFFNLVKDHSPYTSIADSTFSNDSILADFISTHFSSLQSFVNGDLLERVFDFLDFGSCIDHRLRGPCFLSFPTFLEEMKAGVNAAHLSFKFESFSDALDPSLIKFYSSLGLDHDEILLDGIEPPKAEPYRYKKLVLLSDPLNRLICRLSEELGDIGCLGYSF